MPHLIVPKRMISRRDFLRMSGMAGAGLALSSVLGACGGKVDVGLISHATYNPNWANTVLNELADHFGWLQDEGIESQEITIVEQTQIFPALEGGALNTAQQDTDAVAGANLLDVPIRFVSCFRDKEPWIFGVGPDIETVDDLAGKPVSGGSIGSRNYYNGREMLRRLGFDPDLAEWVPVAGGSDSRVAAIESGIIAGTVMFDRHRALIEEMGGKLLHDDLESVPQDCFCVHQDWLDDNEDVLVAYLTALTRARLFYHDLDNKDEIISIMESRGYEFPPSFVTEYARAVAINSPTGQFDIPSMDKLIEDSIATGSLEEEIDWHVFVNMDYQNEAYKKLDMDDQVVDYG
jgi:ABC-type nitrate/sulfonate/bicarbonate transport system substrate-binding protein